MKARIRQIIERIERKVGPPVAPVLLIDSNDKVHYRGLTMTLIEYERDHRAEHARLYAAQSEHTGQRPLMCLDFRTDEERAAYAS